ncbi:NAD-dependent epimerase/dehydratase family protein [Saccharopolyspora sp. 5N708]|uniref:NAD-dependent epimerase/dehydratase family protein n=1 Tax=Saccharopolyspora sp. 5N708 TaxID=3457424 RepID=UPI003FD577FF
MRQRILITGAAGIIGTMMRSRLRREGRVLRLLDRAPLPPAEPGEAVETITADLTDPAAMAEACEGVDAVLHLGGHSRENSWTQTLAVNVDGTHTVLEAIRQAGVGRVILASSNHAAGFRPVDAAGPGGLPADSPARPDTYYGVSKAAIEALGSLYHSRFGIDVICIRIGSCFERPSDVRGLSLWLSPDDAALLFEACLSHPSPGYRVIWGVSANTRRLCSLAEAEDLGYQPQDDAEKFAAEVEAGVPSPHLGGPFTTAPLGEPN